MLTNANSSSRSQRPPSTRHLRNRHPDHLLTTVATPQRHCNPNDVSTILTCSVARISAGERHPATPSIPNND
eukprot:3314719-Alexandrium_andersonii.AAC.1